MNYNDFINNIRVGNVYQTKLDLRPINPFEKYIPTFFKVSEIKIDRQGDKWILLNAIEEDNGERKIVKTFSIPCYELYDDFELKS